MLSSFNLVTRRIEGTNFGHIKSSISLSQNIKDQFWNKEKNGELEKT